LWGDVSRCPERECLLIYYLSLSLKNHVLVKKR
jgi:hypothetical protein